MVGISHQSARTRRADTQNGLENGTDNKRTLNGSRKDSERTLKGNGTETGGPLNGPFMGSFFLRILYLSREKEHNNPEYRSNTLERHTWTSIILLSI